MPVPANIAARIVFSTALSSWESQIRGWLDQAWDSFSDSTVRNMLLSLESDNRVLNFNYVLNSTGRSLPGSYSVDINPSAPGFTDPQQKIYLFGSDGKPFEVTPARAVYHEMVHAILGLDDGPTGYPGVPFSPTVLANADVAELRGPTVDKENAIAAGIGDPNIRVSYTGGGTFVELGGRTEVSWSDGELLTTALVDQDTGTTAQTWDLSHLGTSTDLFLAMGGYDTVFGGGGNDYLYGGDGNDQLYGGQGNDVLHGGNIGTTYTSHPLGTPNYSDGFDTANYLHVKNDGILGFFREKSAAPIAITVAPSFGPRPLGATTDIITVDDGTGGTDRLLSIEKIIGTVHNDTVSVTGGTILGGPLTIDLDGGVNSISYNGGTPTTLDGPINYLYRTTLEDGTPTGRDGPQTVSIAAGVDKVLLQNSLLYVDGQQLVGGSSFKINRQDYTTTEQANNLFDVPDVVNYAEALAYKAQAVVQNPTAGGSIWDTVLYSDQETRRTVGVWGERYEFAGTNFDVPSTLTITIRDAADYQIQLSGWKNGDFGIFLIDAGLASALDNNGRLDDWRDLYLPDVVAQLGSVGFSQHIYTDPESETPEGAQRNGTTGHDVILGSAQADNFRGTLGNDTLSGGEGNDTYYFGLGHGNDVIIETTTGQNTIELASSVSVGTIQQSVDGNDLVLSFGSTQGGSIRILDTTDWSRWTILNLTDPSPTLDGLGSSDKVIINGTAASETLSSPDTLSMIQERLFGFDGNDLLKGERGEDDLIGGAGSDTLFGGSGNDRLEGGVGDDLMIGGVNYDTYVYSEGDGNDTILDEGQTKTLESDTLRLVGLPLTSTNAIVLKTANGQGAILSFAGVSGSITITNQFLGAGQHGIEKFVFADGVTWTDVQFSAAINLPPVVAAPILDQTINEDEAWSFQVPAGAFSDPQGTVLTYSATLASSSALPSWLTFDPITRTFSGTPPQDQNGTISLRVVASDGVQSVADDFDLIINPVNDAAVISGVATGTVTEAGGVANASAGTPIATGDLHATDVDTATDTWQAVVTSLGSANGYGTYTVTSAGVWTYTLNNSNASVQSLANGETLTDSFVVLTQDGTPRTVSMTINGGNDAPTVTSGSTGTVAHGTPSTSVVYTAAGTDPDAGNTILWSLAAGGDSSLLNINANTGEVRLNASANYAFKSTYIFTVVATDNGGLTNSRAVTLNVPNPNQAPTNITLSSAAVVEAAANGLEIGTLAAVDANATDTHTYTLLANPDGRFSIAGNKLVVASGVRLDFEQATSHSITVRATDSAGATFDKNFTIAVTDASPEVVMGDATGNIIKGGAGHDSLDGGAGVDTLEGGAGSDTYVVDVLGDVVVENFNGGDDVVRVAGASYVLAANVYVETLEAAVLTGTTALNLTGNDFGVSIKGNDGNNLLTGGSGSDLINGRAGTDSLVGGAGNDFYWTDGGDTITETLNAGTDTVYSTVNYVLGTGSNLENLTIFGVATTATGNELDNKLTGNDLANTLTGGAGNDQLDGGLGADTLDGGAGDDWYFVNAASDIVRETSSSGAADRVFASASYTLSNEATYGFVEILSTNDVNGTAAINLTGNTRANQIIGNAGNNIIAGWQGQDTLTGGAGSDTFDFNAIADSTVGITRDRITDFVHLVDKIDLNTIDANATISGNQDFSSVLLNASGAGSAGRIKVYEQGGVATIVEAFVNAGSVADFQIQITGIGLGLTSADFVL